MSEMSKLQDFTVKLLKWWNPCRFDYPWRKTSDPYKILVSEFMLRKTTRKQVSEIYNDFFSRYATVRALYVADVESIENIIRPLGMQHVRAVALKKLAEIVVKEHDEKIPAEKHLLEKLPGVGAYIANAVLCLAYGKDVPLLDTNVLRVMKRVFSLKSSRKRVRDDPKMWKAVSFLIPKNRARDFNLAMLDFAAFICLPKKPKCIICPMQAICDYGLNYLRQCKTGNFIERH